MNCFSSPMFSSSHPFHPALSVSKCATQKSTVLSTSPSGLTSCIALAKLIVGGLQQQQRVHAVQPECLLCCHFTFTSLNILSCPLLLLPRPLFAVGFCAACVLSFLPSYSH